MLRLLIITGLLIGICALLRGIGLVLVIAAPITLLLLRVPFRTTAKAAFLLGALTVLTISPWTIRNYVVMKSLIFISGDLMFGMWMGANPDTTGGHMDLDPDIVSGKSTPEQWRAAGREALRSIREHPLTFLGYAPAKLGKLISDDSSGSYWSVVKISGKVPDFLNFYSPPLNITDFNCTLYVAILLLSLVGVVPCLLARPLGTLAVVLLAVWVSFHMLVIGENRLHVPMGPLLTVLAGSAPACCLLLLRRSVGGVLSRRREAA